ncbi:MAG: type II toxin-antitoxin system VapC family toxin [Vicinamibacterales bacterium]
MTKRRTPAGAPRRRRRRAVGTTADVAVALRYVESSALVAALLERDSAARAAIRGPGRRVSSSLTLAEATRAVIRARATGRLTAADERAAVRALQVFARRCDLVSVTDAVLARAARPCPVEPIRTLDAVHLATVEQLGEPPALITIVTRDARVRENARVLGYATE